CACRSRRAPGRGRARSGSDARCRWTSLAPHLRGGLQDELQLAELLVGGQVVALARGREAALRREAELVDVHVLRGLLDAALEVVLALELRALRRHEAEHDD